MKKRFIVGMASLGACFMGAIAVAAQTDWTPTGVGCTNTGNCFVIISPPLTAAQTSCPIKDQIRFPATGYGEGMHKTALTALASGRRLVINPTSTCVESCSTPAWIYMK